MLVLPFLAVPLGLNGSRTSQFSGVVLGIFVLIVYEKTLELGGSLSGIGAASIWTGLWLPFVIFSVAGALLFYYVSHRVGADPTDWLTRKIDDLMVWAQRLLDQRKTAIIRSRLKT